MTSPRRRPTTSKSAPGPEPRSAGPATEPPPPRRPYRLQRRAEQQEETRQRIVAATYALHREIGPARTTISAIAERACVERLTVYRHFADEASLFAAYCPTRRDALELRDLIDELISAGAAAPR